MGIQIKIEAKTWSREGGDFFSLFEGCGVWQSYHSSRSRGQTQFDHLHQHFSRFTLQQIKKISLYPIFSNLVCYLLSPVKSVPLLIPPSTRQLPNFNLTLIHHTPCDNFLSLFELFLQTHNNNFLELVSQFYSQKGLHLLVFWSVKEQSMQ